MEGFKHPFYKQLKSNNRWVKLAEVIPWDELAGIYSMNLDPGAGRLSVDDRMVIGALIIKHKQKLSDRRVQYFLTFSAMKHLRTVFLPEVVYDWIPVGNKKTVSA